MASETEVKTVAPKMSWRERREYLELRRNHYPAIDAKAIARTTTAFRRAANSCAP